MRSLAFAALLILAVITTMLTVIAFASPEGDDAFLGRWDITATGSQSGHKRFCWLELRRDKGVLKGRFNAGGGAVFDLPQVAIENGELKFQYPQGNPPKETQQIWKATVKTAGLVGTALVNGSTLSWTGVRGPVWPVTPPERKPGRPVDLFNGKDVSGWLCQDPGRPMGWFVKDGILMNEGKKACNIYSQQKFNDFKSGSRVQCGPAKQQRGLSPWPI